MNPAYDAFADDAESALGADRVIRRQEDLHRLEANVSGFERVIPLSIEPETEAQVLEVVRLANRHRIPLYPVSLGKNWGLGSRLPIQDGCVLVALHRMNRIREVNDHFGYAVIEPGVTQQQLADHLEASGSPFLLDVTGSGAATSVLGNALERGVAYNTLRYESLRGLEVVLGRGELLRTGFGHYESSQLTHLFPSGIGPALDGLFIQSNFGIVTAAAIRLLKKPARLETFLMSLRDEALFPRLIDRLQELKRDRVLTSVVHVGNRRRTEITLAPLIYEYYRARGESITRKMAGQILDAQLKGPWSAVGNLMGPTSLVRAAKRELKLALGGLGTLRFMTPRTMKRLMGLTELLGMRKQRAFLAASSTLFQLTRGIPGDGTLRSIYWPVANRNDRYQNPDEGNAGILFCAPVIPMRGQEALEAVRLVREEGAAHGFDPAMTLNTLQDQTLEGVISIDFRRDDSSMTDRAHRCMRALNQRFLGHGFTPYRIDIQNMPLMLDPNDPFWWTVRELKTVLDPNHIIAPRKFNLV